MRDTLLANVGCLAVFQVAASDARELIWEMGKDRVTEEPLLRSDLESELSAQRGSSGPS